MQAPLQQQGRRQFPAACILGLHFRSVAIVSQMEISFILTVYRHDCELATVAGP
jgi:hypothetical protein